MPFLLPKQQRQSTEGKNDAEMKKHDARPLTESVFCVTFCALAPLIWQKVVGFFYYSKLILLFAEWSIAFNVGLVCGVAAVLQLYVDLNKDSILGCPCPWLASPKLAEMEFYKSAKIYMNL